MNTSEFTIFSNNLLSTRYTDESIHYALNPSEQEVVEQGNVSLRHQKLVNSALSLDAKAALVKDRTVQKTLSMDGFTEEEVEFVDRDTVNILKRDANGNIISRTPVRLQAYGNFDGTDAKKFVDESSFKSLNQPKFVSALTGKPEEFLTDFDYDNVKAYETQETFKAATYIGKDMYRTEGYNPSIDYTKDQSPKTAKMLLKTSGFDRYGRVLGELTNPYNKKDIGFELANNPYTNTAFDVFKTLDTEHNRQAVKQKFNSGVQQSFSKRFAELRELSDKDIDGTVLGRLGEDLDMVQASFYRMWARAAQYGPKAIMDTDYWAKVADESTGQEIADAWAGVKTSTRRAIANEMTKGLDQWKNGNYVDSIITFGSQLDRLFAESAAQTITGVAVGVATLGAGLAAGAGTATASTIAMVSGATTAAVDNTLMSIEEYEANNDKTMSGADAAKTFAGYLALAIPDTLFGALGIGKLLPKAISSSMNSAYKQGAKLSAGKHLVGGIVGEAAQEMGEESFGTYMSQDEKNAQSFTDILTSPETAVAGVAGGLMGGGLAAIPAAKGFTFDARKEAKQDEEREKIVEQQATKTVTGATLDKVQETEAQATISRIMHSAPTADTYASGKSVDGNEIKKHVQDLDKVIISNVSEKTVAQATEVKSALVKRYVESLKTEEECKSFLSDLGMTPAEALAEQASSVNARNTYIKTGKRLTSKANDKVRKELEAYGKLLGMTDEEISKTLEEVIVEARDSWKGYKTYEKRINNALITLNTEGASEDDIELAKADLSSSAKQVARFYGSQLGKLDALVSGLTKLANTDTLKSITVKYPSGKGKFTITAADIVSRGHESGASRTFRAVLNEAKELQRIINTLPEETKKAYELDKLNLDELDALKTAFNNAIDKYITHEGSITKTKVAAKSKTTDKGLDATNAISMLKSLHSKTKYNDNVIATMHTRLATVSDTTFNEIVDILNNDKTLSDSTRQSYINTLTNVRNRFTQSAQNVSKLQEQQAKAIKEVKNIISKYSDLSDIDDNQQAKVDLDNARKRLIAINTKESKELLKKLVPVLNNVLYAIKVEKGAEQVENKNENQVKQQEENNVEDTLISSIKSKAGINEAAVNKVLGIADTTTEEDSELLRNLENGYTDNEDAYFADESSSDDAILSAVKGKADTTAINKVLGITTKADKNAALNIIATSQTTNTAETAAEENTADETQEIETFYKENHLSDLVHSPEELLDVEKNPIVNNTFEGTPDKEGKSRLVITTPIIHDIKPINSNRRISTVMEEGIKNFEYLKSVVAVVNKALRLDFSAYKRTSEKINVYRALSSFSPHMNLLYATSGSSTSTIKETGKTVTKYYGTEMNPSVLLAIDFACKDLLSSMSIDDTFTPKDKSRVLSLFHINDETTSIKDYKLLRDEVKKHGIPKNAFARRLGKLAMQHIGLTKRKYDAQYSDLKPKYGGYERLEIGMGLFALDYMVAKGLITYDAINPTEVNAKATDSNLLTSEHKIKTIKVKNKTAIEKEVTAFLGKFVNATDEKGNIIKDINGKAKRVRKGDGLKSLYYKDKTNNIYGPSTKPIESNEDAMYIDGTNDMMIVPEFQRKRIEKVQQTPHIINSELVELLENNIETVKDNLGYSEQADINNMHSDAASSAEGVNASIDSQLNYLIEYNNKQLAEPNTKWYFKAFFSKNGRLFYDSPTLNPQSGKSLTRFLVLPEELYSVFKVGNENDEMLENYAISQAFDYLGNQEASDNLHKALNSLTAKELKQMLSDFVSMKHSEFFKKYNAILFKAVGAEVKLKGIENFGQCLNTLQHLYKKKEYIESGSKGEFKSWLAVENDSTTSGYAIRILQYPSEKIVKNFAKKVGLMETNDEDANTPMHILKKKKGFLDIYKTIAKDVADILAPIFDGTLSVSDMYIRYNEANSKKKLRTSVDVLSKAFELAKEALPKPEIKDGEIVISSALRTLMKPVVMVFGYTGGKSAITSNMSEDIAENYLNSFMTIQTAGGLDAYIKANSITDKDEIAKLKSIYDTVSYIASMHEKANTPVKFYNLLKTTGISDVWLQVGLKQKLTLDRFLNEMFMPIYGEAAWNTLENHFAEHNAYNELVNTAIASMYQLFSKVWQPVYDNMLKNANTTQATFERKVEELAGLWPSIPLIYTELKSLTDGKTDLTYDELRKSVLLMNFERQPSKIGNISNALPKMENGKRVYDSDGKPKFDTSTSDSSPDLKVFANPKKAGAVVPIHYIDGMIMAATLAETLGIPVHDALVMSFSSVTEGTRNYNEALYYICEQYDLFGLIVDRFNKVVDEYEKFRTSTDRDYVKYREENLKGAKLPSTEEMQIIDGFGKIFKPKYADYYFDYYTGTSNDYLTFTDLQEALESARRDNTADRQAYFSKQHSIANMDGPKGSVVSSDDIHTAAVYAAGAQYASASGFVSSGEMEELLNTTNSNPKARIKIIHKLQELAKTLGNTVMSDEYVSHIENLIGKLNIDQIKNYTVNVIKDAEFTSGVVKHDTKEILVGFDSKQGTDIDNTTGLSIRSQQSAVEIYAHETIHAATRYALVNLKLTKVYKEIQQLLNLQKAAMEVVTWEDFMPDNYDPNLRDVYEAEAKKTWEYIFNNKNTEELAGLSEFMAYGLTNPKLMAKLKQHTVVEKQAKGSILDRLVSFFKNLLGVLTGNATVGETYSSLMDLLKGNRVAFKHSETIYQELDRLVTQLSHADKKAVNKFLKHPYKAIKTLYTVYRLAMKKGNSYLVPAIKYITNYLDEHNMQYSMGSKINSNWFSTPKKLAALVAGYAFSSSRRQALKEVLAALTGASQQSLLASIYRDVTISDAASGTLEAYSMYTRMIDANSKGIEALSYQDIMSKFDKSLDDKDTESLTRTCLFTDLQCLTNDMSIKQIKELLTNSFALNDEIMRTEHAINSIDEKDYMWLRNQAFGLARFMVTGVGNECQNLNAYNIAAKLMMDDKAHTIDTEIVKLVDKLATLYALSFTDNSVKKITAQLNDAGLENYLKQAKAFVEENVTGTTKTGEDAKTVETLHIVKGYTKQILDDSYDVRVDAVANKDALNDAGYVLVTKLADNDATGLKGLALYRRSLARPKRREGAAFTLNGAHAIGTTLKDTAYSVGGATNSVDAADLVLDYKKGIRTAEAKLNRLMKSKEMTLQDFSANSSGYTPILSTDSGNPVDYRITMSTDNKVKHLGMELDGTRILSKMFATHNTKLEAKVRNNALIDFLYGHMNENMNDNYRDADGNKYVKITPNTTNKYLKEAWKVIPEALKYRVNEKPLYVREDWLQYLFGVENMSAVDLVEKRMKHQRPALWKRVVALTETLLQTVAYAAKRAVVLFTPGVLVGNELSNINYSAMTHGVGFLKVARMHLRNAQATRDYIDTKKELNKILFKERIGTATTSEISKKRWLRSKLENNIVHPLMEKGMYQAIVEDLSTSDLEATGKLQKFIKNLDAFKKIPKPLKTLARVLYLGEGTFVSNLMTQATQYSDFVARATEYQLQMVNAPERYEMYTINGKKLKRESDKYRKYEEKVSKDILDTFINYDKPQSSIEQYSNDMGFLMFTKFAKRIQGVIGKTITENPMGAIMFLLTQGMVYDTEDILEHNILSKRWSSLVHNPIDNFMNTIVPVPVQYALNMRQAW